MDVHQILHEGRDLRKTLTVAVILMGSGFACHVVQKGSITSVVARAPWDSLPLLFSVASLHQLSLTPILSVFI